MNVLVLAALVFVVARPLGWIAGGLQPSLRRPPTGSDGNLTFADTWSWSAWWAWACAVVAVLIVAGWCVARWRDAWPGTPSRRRAQLVGGAAIWAVACAAVAFVGAEVWWWLANRPAAGNPNELMIDGWRALVVLAPLLAALGLLLVLYIAERVRHAGMVLPFTRQWSYVLVLIAGVLALIVFGIPALVLLAREIRDNIDQYKFFGTTVVDTKNHAQTATITALVSITTAVVTSIAAVWRFARGKGRFLVPIVAFIVGPLLVLILVAAGANEAADSGARTIPHSRCSSVRSRHRFSFSSSSTSTCGRHIASTANASGRGIASPGGRRAPRSRPNGLLSTTPLRSPRSIPPIRRVHRVPPRSCAVR